MFSHSVMSNSLQLHELQHARFPCPSLFSQSLLRLMSVEPMMPSNYLILCGLLFLLPSVLPSIRVFSNESALKSLLQHHSSKASILQHSAFFMIQLLHPYLTAGKAIALTRQTLVGKAMSLLFNMLFRLVIAFLPRSKCPLISWLQSPSAVILEPPKLKSLIISTSICQEMIGPDVMLLVF